MVIQTKLTTICVVGAGYVGLPLSRMFAGNHRVISFDIDRVKVFSLSSKNDNPNHTFTSDPREIGEADFIFICVPTLLTENKRPDMSYLADAGMLVGQNMKKGAVVILESSVFPGATEELLKPILEEHSGFRCGIDFKLAYSPERINPGDDEHGVDRVIKLVAACDDETLKQVYDLYRHITPCVFPVRSIKAAEAAKLLENTQRDLNIALINELSILFQKMGISTEDVLDAAATKWNFQRLSPGLVGGHCIPVVPYFLAEKAREFGVRSRLILAAREVNDFMPRHVARMAVSSIIGADKSLKTSKVLIMGCTYKENVPDTRESPVRGIIDVLREYGAGIYGYDPLITDGEAEFGIKFLATLDEAPRMDCIILAVAHDVFKEIKPGKFLQILNPQSSIIDVRGCLKVPEGGIPGISYLRL